MKFNMFKEFYIVHSDWDYAKIVTAGSVLKYMSMA